MSYRRRASRQYSRKVATSFAREFSSQYDRVVAMVPAGTMNKKVKDEELDRVRRGLARLYRARPKRRVKVKPMKYYKGRRRTES